MAADLFAAHGINGEDLGLAEDFPVDVNVVFPDGSEVCVLTASMSIQAARRAGSAIRAMHSAIVIIVERSRQVSLASCIEETGRRSTKRRAGATRWSRSTTPNASGGCGRRERNHDRETLQNLHQ
jgi:hypothetical protein